MQNEMRHRIYDHFGTGTGHPAYVQFISEDGKRIELLDYHGLGHDLVQTADDRWQLVTEGQNMADFYAEDAYMAVAIVAAIWDVYTDTENS